MVINHNVPALFTHLSMRRADRGLQQAMTRLSSGIRINSAREDAAGLAIANKLNYQVGGLNRASENATHGISLIQTAEGALNEVHNMLQRMRELAVQAAHGSLTPENRGMIQQEIDQLTAEIHSISRNTEYNRLRILNGEANRVIDNTMWNAAEGVMQTTRNIVSTLFVSHQVSPGQLNYSITQAGHGAMVELTPQLVPEIDPETGIEAVPARMVFPPNTAININGMNSARFDLSGKTWSEASEAINRQLPFLGLSMYTGSGDTEGSFFLVSNLAGADQIITLTGSLGAFGLTEGMYYLYEDDGAGGIDPVLDGEGNHVQVRASDPLQDGFSREPVMDGGEQVEVPVVSVIARGRDAQVSLAGPMIPNPDFNPLDPIDPVDNPEFIPLTIDGTAVQGGLLDANGNPVPGASLGDSVSGNHVTLRGSRGEEIRLNIQVMFNPATGQFEFPGGIAISELEPGGDHAGGLHMSKEFLDFGPIMLQIGPSHNQAMPVQIPRINAETLGLVKYVGGQQRQLIDVRPSRNDPNRGAIIQFGAEAAIEIADAAIHTVSNLRARLGAYQNRLESTVRNLNVAAENTEVSRSRIQDTDMARETTRFAQYNVMFQAAMAILSQANQRPQQIISLLQ